MLDADLDRYRALLRDADDEPKRLALIQLLIAEGARDKLAARSNPDEAESPLLQFLPVKSPASPEPPPLPSETSATMFGKPPAEPERQKPENFDGGLAPRKTEAPLLMQSLPVKSPASPEPPPLPSETSATMFGKPPAEPERQKPEDFDGGQAALKTELPLAQSLPVKSPASPEPPPLPSKTWTAMFRKPPAEPERQSAEDFDGGQAELPHPGFRRPSEAEAAAALSTVLSEPSAADDFVERIAKLLGARPDSAKAVPAATVASPQPASPFSVRDFENSITALIQAELTKHDRSQPDRPLKDASKDPPLAR